MVLLIVIIGVLARSARSSITAHKDRIPFVVSLENEGGQFCSGTIVTNNWILTAASCVWNKLSTEISVGIQPLNAESGSYHQKAHKIYVHPDFVGQSLGNDVALIKLKRAIKWNGHSVMMRLVNDSGYEKETTGCLVLGWDRFRVPPVRAEVVPLLDREMCVGDDLHGLCVNTTDDRFCKFHSGSPVLCLREESFSQLAFLSGRKHCNQSDSLVTFTSIALSHEWIMRVVHHNTPKVESQGESRYLNRLSRFNWLVMAILVFICSVVILIKVLRSRFRVR